MRQGGWRWQAWLSVYQGAMSQQNIGTNVLREYESLAAFPRLKFVAEKQIERALRLIEVVVERSEFAGEVVTLFNELSVGFETRKPLGKAMAGALQELVVFIQDACIAGRSGAGFG
jgi:DNA-binding transcriptional regulator YbjK